MSDKPVFPTELTKDRVVEEGGYGRVRQVEAVKQTVPGLTRRELFAMAAMQGILACQQPGGFWGPERAERLVGISVATADALIAELDRSES